MWGVRIHPIGLTRLSTNNAHPFTVVNSSHRKCPTGASNCKTSASRRRRRPMVPWVTATKPPIDGAPSGPKLRWSKLIGPIQAHGRWPMHALRYTSASGKSTTQSAISRLLCTQIPAQCSTKSKQTCNANQTFYLKSATDIAGSSIKETDAKMYSERNYTQHGCKSAIMQEIL